ncbi:MAG: hypothetical protein KatS3mg121_0943 [Gammaproteobacteria bacterium]|nr:MAG: hypothetical protein KatS3mg121_0943 [Gammaproteobacteria bacterium]
MRHLGARVLALYLLLEAAQRLVGLRFDGLWLVEGLLLAAAGVLLLLRP